MIELFTIVARKGILVALAILCSVAPVMAMSVEPMVLDMSVTGKGASQSFKVSNPGTQPLPLEISTFALELGPNGEQELRANQDNFLIYPPQAMIPAGGSQVFRVQWIGDPEITKSQTFRVNVSQIPVKFAKNASGIQFVLSFGVTVNVSPSKGSANIIVLDASPFSQEGKRVAALRVKNPGNKNAYLNNTSVHLAGDGWSAKMGPADIAQKVGLGIVQPGKERRFVLPVEVPANVSAIEATVKLQPGG